MELLARDSQNYFLAHIPGTHKFFLLFNYSFLKINKINSVLEIISTNQNATQVTIGLCELCQSSSNLLEQIHVLNWYITSRIYIMCFL